MSSGYEEGNVGTELSLGIFRDYKLSRVALKH